MVVRSIGNQSGKGHLIEPGIGADGRKRRVLNGREVVACFPDFGQEHRHRDLLEAARQMSGHVMGVFHGTLRGRRDVDEHTGIQSEHLSD